MPISCWPEDAVYRFFSTSVFFYFYLLFRRKKIKYTDFLDLAYSFKFTYYSERKKIKYTEKIGERRMLCMRGSASIIFPG